MDEEVEEEDAGGGMGGRGGSPGRGGRLLRSCPLFPLTVTPLSCLALWNHTLAWFLALPGLALPCHPVPTMDEEEEEEEEEEWGDEEDHQEEEAGSCVALSFH
jgi:hypothetical protein